MTYTMKVAGLERQLPLCKVSDELYIGAFIIFGDAELTVACASALLERIPADSYDYMLTAEAKSSPVQNTILSPAREARCICATPSMYPSALSPPCASRTCSWVRTTAP